MEESQEDLLPSDVPESTSSNIGERLTSSAHANRGSGFPGAKKRGLSSRSWIKIDQDGNSKVLELDNETLFFAIQGSKALGPFIYLSFNNTRKGEGYCGQS
ncbi:hypothetical protein V6N13_042357 [Hibiscus sabdariffa]